MADHPDFEALSAYYDGEAPELSGHVEQCDICGATLAGLPTLTDAVASAPEPTEGAAANRMIDRALATGDDAEPKTSRVLPLHRERSRWVGIASVAAVAVLAVGVVGLLARGGGSGTKSETAARPASTSPSQAALAAPQAGAATASPVNGGDVGEIRDGSELGLKVAPALRETRAPAVPDNPVVAAPSDAAPGATATAREVGTMACELQARAADPGAGALVYVADATRDGTPAKVLAFAPPEGGRPISLFLMAQDGCGLLARATLP